MADDIWRDIPGGVHPAVAAWFAGAFAGPTEPQQMAWPAIARGENVLLLAPTGSGKTLAAFLMAISELCRRWERGELPDRMPGPGVLYVSPLRALNNDIHRNLAAPLAGIAAAAAAAGIPMPRLRTAVRTGDTPPDERRRMLREPPHILITTPESLFLLLCSKARDSLRHVRTVIVDETHALFPNKRGVLLSLALEYLTDIAPAGLRRIGLSATQRPLAAIGAYVGGGEADAGQGPWRGRPINLITTPGRRELDVAVELPVSDFADLPENTIWPEIHRQVYSLAASHTSTLVFVNNRQVGERIAAAVNDLAGEDFCRVHHGSISREMRLATEDLLKSGRLRCLVATSTLELGIDIGAIDLVIQVESPHEVGRAVQRVGRSGHVPGLPSKGRIIPKTRHDLLEAAVVVDLMQRRWLEPAAAPENALDVLSQFVAGLVIERPRSADDIYALVRRAYNYRSLSRERFDSVLGLAAGDFDSGDLLDLRALVEVEPQSGMVRATARGRRLIYTSGGTIPDRGEFPVYLQGQGVRLGDLDEEFVLERRIGDRFSLGTSSWRITDIMHDRVLVAPAAGGPRVPFWKGETFGRPYHLGREVAAFLQDADAAIARERKPDGRHDAKPDPFWSRWAARAGLSARSVEILRAYLAGQADATGALPSAATIVVEEFRDELSQWRVVIHTPFGRAVNAPLALLLEEQIRQGYASPLDLTVTDDAILLGGGASEEPPLIDLRDLGAGDLPARLSAAVRRTALFGRLFREAAGRALVLPRLPQARRRTPLWLSRRKASSLLRVAEQLPGFPLIHEAVREALTEVYYLPGLSDVLHGVASGAIKVVRVRRSTPSPFARPAVFAHMGAYFYADDLPPAERRLRYLGLDQAALVDLLGTAPLRSLLEPAAIEAANHEAQPAVLAEHPPSSPEALHRWLESFGELPVALVPPRVAPLLEALASAGKAVHSTGEQAGAAGEVWLSARHAADLSGGRSGDVAAVAALLRRYALRFSPFTDREFAVATGIGLDLVREALRGLSDQGLVRRGAFRPGGTDDEWADPDRLADMHRRSLAIARSAVQPVSQAVYQMFLADWQGLGGPSRRSGPGGLVEVLAQLEGLELPAALWETAILPQRVAGYTPGHLDMVTATGRFSWLAGGHLDRLRLAFWRTQPEPQDPSSVSAPSPPAEAPTADLTAVERAVLEALAAHGAQFTADVWRAAGTSPTEVLAALERLLVRGMIANDTLGPVRYLLAQPAASRSLPRGLTSQALAGLARWTVARQPAPTAPETATRLLTRYGLVSREVATAEGVSWAEIGPVLGRMELLGQVRRGYFVRGLSGVQYALPAAVERLRGAAAAPVPPPLAVCDEDPALAWGRLLPWPEEATRPRHPAVIVLAAGRPLLTLAGRPLRIEGPADAPANDLFEPLRIALDLAQTQVGDRLEVGSYNDAPVRGTAAAAVLAELGFSAAPLTMVRWRAL